MQFYISLHFILNMMTNNVESIYICYSLILIKRGTLKILFLWYTSLNQKNLFRFWNNHCLFYWLRATKIYYDYYKVSNLLMDWDVIYKLTTKASIFTATSQTGSSILPSIMIFPLFPLIQDKRLRVVVLRDDQEKLSFLLAVRRTRANVRSLDKGFELASDKSVDTIRGCSPWRQRRERERKAKWRGGGGRVASEIRREKEEERECVHVCERGGETGSYSYQASRQFGLWRRDVARLERPRESNPESRRTGLWLDDAESTLRLEGVGKEGREKVDWERTPRINRGHWGPGGGQAIARASCFCG